MAWGERERERERMNMVFISTLLLIKKRMNMVKKKKKSIDYNNWGIMTEATLDENGGCIGTLCGQR